MRLNLDSIRFSISTQIALFFTILTFLIVICSSILVTSLLRTTLLTTKAKDLTLNTEAFVAQLNKSDTQLALSTIANQIATNGSTSAWTQQNSFDIIDRLARKTGVPYYMSYTVFCFTDKYTIYLGTNDPYLPLLPIPENAEPVRIIQHNYYSDGDLNILYLTLPAGSFYIQMSINMETDSIDKLLAKLPLIVLFMSIPLLVISFFMSRLLATQMLKPVAEITRTANEISATHLDRRIPESNAKDELHELARTFNLLFARLQADFDRERQFTSDVSHELRTPLAVLSGHIDLLRRWGKNDEKILNDSLETLYHETKSMQALVENLLLLSRSERNKQIDAVVVKMHPLLFKMCEDIKIVEPDAVCTIDCDENATLMTDPEILTQVLRVLTSNSIKYSPKPAHITLVYKKDEQTLLVKDEGYGISKKDLPHIFERLYRADESRNHKTGGSGLGLAIAKTLMANLNGTIRAQSDGENLGTTMILCFKPLPK